MAEWADVQQWTPEPLDGVAEGCRERQRRVEAESDRLFRLRSGVQSQGETAEAVKAFLERRISEADRLAGRFGGMADASSEAARAVVTVQTRVRECHVQAASRRMTIASDGVVRIHPEYLAECQADSQRFARAQAERQLVADAVRETVRFANRVDVGYQAALFELSDSGAADDPLASGGPGDEVEQVPYLDDALDFSYELFMAWLDSPVADEITEASRSDPALFNLILGEAVAYRKGDLSWHGFMTLPVVLANLREDPLGTSKVVGGAYLLYTHIKVNAPWDMKPYLAERYAQPLEDGYFYLTDEEGHSIRSDAFGNVSYGYMLARFGVDEQIALDAANAGTSDTGIGADPVDDASIRLGYELSRKYPDGITREQYIEEMKNANLG